MKWRLTKTQVKMLISGKPVVSGRKKFYAQGDVLDTLKLVDSRDAYHLLDIIVEDGNLDILKKV